MGRDEEPDLATREELAAAAEAAAIGGFTPERESDLASAEYGEPDDTRPHEIEDAGR